MKLSVLALNKNYVPVGIITVKKAFKKLVAGKAKIVHVADAGYYEDYDISSWAEFSALKAMIDDELNGYEDWINSRESDLPIEAPRVIRFLEYDKIFANKVRFSRKNVFLRDDYTCQYCGVQKPIKHLQLEHIVPKSKGGKTTWVNTVCSCDECNNSKRDRTPEQAGMKLLQKPRAPKFLPTEKVRGFKWDKNRYACWENFVSDMYWNVELSD